jgi:hypothetical protein
MSVLAYSQTASPDAVIRKYWNFISSGDLLNSNGWSKANPLFVHTPKEPNAPDIFVVSDDYSIWKPKIRGTVAEVMVGYREIGFLDSQMRFHATNSSLKSGVLYRLELVNVGHDPRVKSLEWQITNPRGGRSATVTATLRYLEEEMRKTTDPLKQGKLKEALRLVREAQGN